MQSISAAFNTLEVGAHQSPHTSSRQMCTMLQNDVMAECLRDYENSDVTDVRILIGGCLIANGLPVKEMMCTLYSSYGFPVGMSNGSLYVYRQLLATCNATAGPDISADLQGKTMKTVIASARAGPPWSHRYVNTWDSPFSASCDCCRSDGTDFHGRRPRKSSAGLAGLMKRSRRCRQV